MVAIGDVLWRDGSAMIGQPPLLAVLVFVAVVAVALAGFVWLVRLIDRRRPGWRDPIAAAGMLTAIGVLLFSAYSFAASSPESRDFAHVPAIGAVVIVGVFVLWWRGYGKPLLLVGGLVSAVLVFVLGNPLMWTFIGGGMLWFVGLLLLFASAAVLGRRGRSSQIARRGRRPHGARSSP